MISGIYHLYFNSTMKDIKKLLHSGNLHKDSLSPLTIRGSIKYIISILKDIPLPICFVPVLLMQIDKFVCFRIQQLLRVMMTMLGTQESAMTEYTPAHEMNSLDYLGRDSRLRTCRACVHDELEVDTENMMSLCPSVKMRGSFFSICSLTFSVL